MTQKIKNLIIIPLILLFFAVNSYGQTFSGGLGTAENPYLISSKADMEALAEAGKSIVPCGTQGSIHHAFSVDCIYG